jgi:hypothetical protein
VTGRLFDLDRGHGHGAAHELRRPTRRRPTRTVDDGGAARDLGADRAANSVHTSWRLAAEAAIGRLAATGRVFDAEDVRDRVGGPPGHHNALGGVFIAAARRGQIRPVGYRASGRREAHRRPIREWVGVW